jgi:hypothetical protein
LTARADGASTDALPPARWREGFSTCVSSASRRAFAAAGGDRVRWQVVGAFGDDGLMLAFGRGPRFVLKLRGRY